MAAIARKHRGRLRHKAQGGPKITRSRGRTPHRQPYERREEQQRAAEAGRHGPNAVIAVQDPGAGIAIAEQARMTQAFARGDASRGTPGTGLGLAVVQQIVRRMGGVLSFDPVDGVACVRVQLPMQ